jgi:hypothetical protein
LGCAGPPPNGALHNPELFAEYVALEREVGYTVHPGKTLEQYAGFTVEQAFAQRRRLPVLNRTVAA